MRWWMRGRRGRRALVGRNGNLRINADGTLRWTWYANVGNVRRDFVVGATEESVMF